MKVVCLNLSEERIRISSSIRSSLSYLLMIAVFLSSFSIAFGQKSKKREESVNQSIKSDENQENMVSNVRIDRVEPIGGSYVLAPLAVDVAAFYSNITNDAGTSVINGGTLTNNTRLISEDTTYTGAPIGSNVSTFTLGAYVNKIVNTDTTSTTLRSRTRIHNPGVSVPGTALAGFSPLANTTYAGNTITTSTSFVAPTPLVVTNPWVGFQFDNSVAGASNTTKTNLMGLQLCSTPDLGSSPQTDVFRTTSGGNQFVSNPVGAMMGIANNMCLELREAATPRATIPSCPVSSTITFTVKFLHPIALTDGVPVTGVLASMFGITTTGSATVSGVTATQVNSTTWTVTANTGAGTGGYNLAINFTGLPFNTTLATTATPPASYVTGSTIGTCTNVPLAGDGEISGRVQSQFGRGISGANISVIDSQTNEVYTARTNQLGYFRISNLAIGNTHILEVRRKGYTFNQQVFTLNENIDGLEITGFRE